VLGDLEDLADGRGFVLRRRAEAEVVEDLADRELPYPARMASTGWRREALKIPIPPTSSEIAARRSR
jgi:hypothetical protein